MDNKPNFLDELISNDIFYLYICSLISADTMFDWESTVKSLDNIQTLKLHAFKSELVTEKHLNYIKEVEEIAMQSLKTFKKDK